MAAKAAPKEAVVEKAAAEKVKDLFSDQEWLVRESLCRAKVSLEGDDFVVVCAVDPDIVRRVVGLWEVLAGLFEGIDKASVEKTLTEAVAKIKEAGLDSAEGGLWQTVEEVLTRCVVKWSLQDNYEGIPDGPPLAPVLIEDVAERSDEISRVMLPIIVRVLYAAGWLLKNSLRRSGPAS